MVVCAWPSLKLNINKCKKLISFINAPHQFVSKGIMEGSTLDPQSFDAEVGLFQQQFHFPIEDFCSRIKGQQVGLLPAFHLDPDTIGIRYDQGSYGQVVGGHGGNNKAV